MDCYLTQTNLGILTQEDRLISFILFDNKYYSQIDGVAEGFPLGQTLAIFFLCHHETILHKRCPKKFGPKNYKRFANNMLFKTLEHIQQFTEYMNEQNFNTRLKTKFQFQQKLKRTVLSLLQILIHREKMENLLLVCTGKKLSVVCTQILPVLFHLIPGLVFGFFKVSFRTQKI